MRASLLKFIDRQVQPGDMIAVCRTASGSGALQQFTSDHRIARNFIGGLRWNPSGLSRTSFLEAYDHDSDLRSANQRARAQDVKQDSPNPRGNGRSGTVIYTMHATGLQVLLPTAGDNPDLSKLRSAAAEVNEAIAAMTKNRSEELFNAQAGIDYLANVTGGFPNLTPLYSEVPGHGSVVRNLLDVETPDLTFSNAAG